MTVSALVPDPTASAFALRVLFVHPRFEGRSFWGFERTAAMYGAKALMPPLGLATVAAMLPQSWPMRIVDRNVTDLTDEDIRSADLVMTGGMLPQRPDLLQVIARVQSAGVPVAVGGPDPMSSPHLYEHADFLVIGEAEMVIDDLVAALRRGERRGRFEAEKAKADVTTSPTPRFDLIDRRAYLHLTVQYSRGCPFTCEFCDIIELFGRRPRTKSNVQMLAELEAIYDSGYRGHVNFVDDNLIGNKRAVKQFLPELIRWQQERGFPFDFSTEASLNLADDDELMTLMAKANFFGVFIGIESPDEDVLNATKKKQNMRRDIAESVHKIYRSGMTVMAGFIMGFDEERDGVGDAVAKLVDEAAIPVAMIGLLYALPETELTRRLAKEGRLHPPPQSGAEVDGTSDQCTQGLNFETVRDRVRILTDFRKVVADSYTPAAYHRRVRKVAKMMRFDHAHIDMFRTGIVRNVLFMMRLSWALGVAARDGKRLYWGTLAYCLRTNPKAFDVVVTTLGGYVHLGPFAETVVAAIDRKIADNTAPQRALIAAE